MTAGDAPRELELGHVLGAFGVRGEVRVFLHNPTSDLLTRPRELVLEAPEGGRRTIRMKIRSGAGKRILGRIDGLTDRDEAAALRGHRLLIDRASLPPAADGEFYVWQIVGADVLLGDAVVGTVADVQHTPGMDVLVVDTGGEEPVFVPCMARWVTSLDTGRGIVVLTEDALEPGEAEDSP